MPKVHKKVPLRDNRVIQDVTPQQCAKLCVQEGSFTCNSFDYCANFSECRLSDASVSNVGQVTLQSSAYCDVYARKCDVMERDVYSREDDADERDVYWREYDSECDVSPVNTTLCSVASICVSKTWSLTSLRVFMTLRSETLFAKVRLMRREV